MNKHILISAFLVISIIGLSRSASAQTTGAGAGVIIGGPTGISAKFWTSPANAIDVSVGWSNNGAWTRFGNQYVYYYSESMLHINADYVWHSFHAIKSAERFPLYYGLGIHFDSGVADPSAFGLRAVGGIEWMPRAVPLDIFLEVAPVFYLAPGAGFGVDAGFGARYFFP